MPNHDLTATIPGTVTGFATPNWSVSLVEASDATGIDIDTLRLMATSERLRFTMTHLAEMRIDGNALIKLQKHLNAGHTAASFPIPPKKRASR